MPSFIPHLHFDIFVNCNWIDTQWQQYSTCTVYALSVVLLCQVDSCTCRCCTVFCIQSPAFGRIWVCESSRHPHGPVEHMWSWMAGCCIVLCYVVCVLDMLRAWGERGVPGPIIAQQQHYSHQPVQTSPEGSACLSGFVHATFNSLPV